MKTTWYNYWTKSDCSSCKHSTELGDNGGGYIWSVCELKMNTFAFYNRTGPITRDVICPDFTPTKWETFKSWLRNL